MPSPRKPYQSMGMAHVIEYMKNATYPPGFTEGEKRNLRKRTKSFALKDGQLYYTYKPKKFGSSTVKREDRLVLTEHEDQIKCIASAHVDSQGNHLGREKVTNIVSQKYYWMGIPAMVREYSQTCQVCQAFQCNKTSILSSPYVTPLARPPQPKAEDLSTVETASIASSDYTIVTDGTDFSDVKVLSDWPFGDNLEPVSLCFWDVVEMSIFGPYESSMGSKFVVTFLDIFSCWVEAFVVEQVSSTVITHFLLTLATRFGAMKNFTLKDIGEFSTLACLPLSRSLKEMANLDITVHSQGSYNTGTQWKEVKDALENFITNNTDWEQCLDFALLPLRISRGSKADYTPAYLTYGRELRLPSILSHRNDMEHNSASDPHLTSQQMQNTSDLLLGLYKDYKADLTPTELSASDHEDSTPTTIKEEETTSFRVPEQPVRITRGTKRTYGELNTGKVDDISEIKEESKKAAVDKDYVDDTDEIIMNTRANKRDSLSKQREAIPVETDMGKFNDTDGTTEHSYAGSPQEDIGIHKFYSALCLYKKEQRYPPKSGEHFKRAIRQASKRYILNKDGLFLLVGGIPKKVPIQFEGRMALLKSAHVDDKGHHCTKSQMMQALSKYTWRGIHLDCDAYSRACSGCNHGRDLSSVMRSTCKDEKVAEIAEENYELLVQYLKKNKLPGKCSKEEEDKIKKIAHLFKFENGQVFLKETKIAPARCLELTPRSRKAAIRKACTRIALPELDQEDLYREVIKHHIWNGMKDDIAKYVKDNGGHLSEDMGDSQPSQGASKNLKQIYSRVEEFKQYFKKKENESRGSIKSAGKLENKLASKNTAEKTVTVPTVLSTEPPSNIENTKEKTKSILGKKKAITLPQPKKVYLVSTTRDTANTEGQDQAKIMIHIEEIDDQNVDKEDSQVADSVSQGKKVGGPPTGVSKKTESVVGSVITDNSDPVHQTVVSDSSQSCTSSTQASDPVTAAAVKSILDIGPETLNRACRVSPVPQTNREGAVIMDLDTYKTIGGPSKGTTQDNNLIEMHPVEEANEVTIEIVMDEEAQTARNETTVEVANPVQVTADNTYEDKKMGNHAMFNCTVCNKMIRGVVKYKIHMYQHTGVKPFKCEVCNKVFTTPKSKKLHQRKHLGFSPYLCNICGKSFSLNGSLRAHIKIHEKGGNVVVHCKICDRAFASRNRYERHMKFRHPANPPVHKCEECNKTFTTSRAQKRHHISHHLRVKCHLCGICGRQFYRKEYLTSHMLQHSISSEDDPSQPKRRKSVLKKSVPVMKVDEMSEPEQLSPTLESAPVMEEVVMDNFDVPHVVSNSTTVQQVSYTDANVQVENTFYAIQTHDGDPDMEQTVVYGYPAVQYEVECSSAGELDSEALSAINLLAQASASQEAETVTYVSDGY